MSYLYTAPVGTYYHCVQIQSDGLDIFGPKKATHAVRYDEADILSKDSALYREIIRRKYKTEDKDLVEDLVKIHLIFLLPYNEKRYDLIVFDMALLEITKE